MKKIIIAPVVALLFLCGILLMASCKKSSDTASGFTWTYRDTMHTAVLHRAFINSMAPTPIIMANKTNSIRPIAGNHVSIALTAFAVGTYNVTTGSAANGLTYVNSQGYDEQATAGTITITSYANNLLSGTFSVTLTELISGITRPLTGSFTDTPVE